jgi:nucleoside-diphosphate-sugar epimerase
LVTGGTGFIGSHLCERLKSEGMNFKLFQGDVRNERDVIRNLRDVDIVIHLSALAYVPPSFHSAESYLETNTFGTLNFLKNWDMFDRMIYVSTSHTFGNVMNVFGIDEITEETPQTPCDPYSVSKLAAEQLVKIFGEAEGRDYVILRPFNNFGPRHSKAYVIPSMICQALEKGEIIIRGDSMRDFTYVEDTVDAFFRVLTAKKLNHKVYNISSEQCYRISDVAGKIFDLIGKERKITILPRTNRPLDIPILHASAKRIREELGWRPNTTLEAGLRKTIDWWGKRLGIHTD